MSRDLVEQGLGWRWTAPRIQRIMRDAHVNVAVSRDGVRLRGFGILQYKDDEAHLLLLAVSPEYRRRRVGADLMGWLEATALTAGIGFLYLEARAANVQARAFYAALGYTEIDRVHQLYSNSEDGVRLAKDLWA